MLRLIFLAALCPLLLPASTNAGVIGETTVSFAEKNLGGLTFDGLTINWSTDLMTGNVTAPDLSNLSVSLTNNGVPVYTDTAIVGDLVQPIAGITRTFSSINYKAFALRLG